MEKMITIEFNGKFGQSNEIAYENETRDYYLFRFLDMYHCCVEVFTDEGKKEYPLFASQDYKEIVEKCYTVGIEIKEV